MNPLFIIAVPLGLVILGMVLNSFDLGFNQPMSSAEQDPMVSRKHVNVTWSNRHVIHLGLRQRNTF